VETATLQSGTRPRDDDDDDDDDDADDLTNDVEYCEILVGFISHSISSTECINFRLKRSTYLPFFPLCVSQPPSPLIPIVYPYISSPKSFRVFLSYENSSLQNLLHNEFFATGNRRAFAPDNRDLWQFNRSQLLVDAVSSCHVTCLRFNPMNEIEVL